MDRTELTFGQAEGAQPLPSQLALKVVSLELSALLWRYIDLILDSIIKWSSPGYGAAQKIEEPWNRILRDFWVEVLHRYSDDFPEANQIRPFLKDIITSRDYLRVFELLQFVIRHDRSNPSFAKTIDGILREARAAYRVIDKTVTPVATEAEASAIQNSIEIVAQSGIKGASAHLRSSAEALSKGDWASSIRDSIHAVEAAAKAINPNAITLGPALDLLQNSGHLSPALKKAFSALYGYSSDEKGIRHSLVFTSEANVSEREALFMFGACAAFVSYLIMGWKEAGKPRLE